MCIEQCWRGMSFNLHLLNNKSSVYIVINFSQVFIRKGSSIGSAVTSETRGPGFESCARHLTEFFFLLVYDDILLACDFCISFPSSSLFLSNWGKLNISSTFYANFCSFLISHELGSTDISTPQQLPARGHHVYSCNSSCSFVIDQFRWTSSRTHLKPKYKFCMILLTTRVSTLLRWDVKWLLSA